MAKAVEIYFDFLSPYAYIAWTQIHALAAKYGREVRPVPTLLAALLSEGKTRGPAEIPAKRAYLIKDTLRTARALGIPFAPPKTHPFNPLLPLRVCSLDLEPRARRSLVDALFAISWGGARGPNDTGLESREAIVAAANGVGLDGAELVARASEEDGKARLRTQTEQAIAYGIFGVPTMRVGGEIYWGYDSFPHLERALVGEPPPDPEVLAAWAALESSAQRRLTP